jgi:hypothetical protein
MIRLIVSCAQVKKSDPCHILVVEANGKFTTLRRGQRFEVCKSCMECAHKGATVAHDEVWGSFPMIRIPGLPWP